MYVLKSVYSMCQNLAIRCMYVEGWWYMWACKWRWCSVLFQLSSSGLYCLRNQEFTAALLVFFFCETHHCKERKSVWAQSSLCLPAIWMLQRLDRHFNKCSGAEKRKLLRTFCHLFFFLKFESSELDLNGSTKPEWTSQVKTFQSNQALIFHLVE